MAEMEVTASERQLLEILREKHVDGFRLVVERDGGAWEVTLSGPLSGRPRKSLGRRRFAGLWTFGKHF
jgi:hypothetical protein